MPKKQFSRAEIEQKANLNVPTELKQKYVDILYKHQAAISISKMDLGRAKNFTHKIHLKDNNPVYRKQFKIPEADNNWSFLSILIPGTPSGWFILELSIFSLK